MKIGIYVDAANISLNGGYSMRYDVLKNYCLNGESPTRLNTYLPYDYERAKGDYIYKDKQQNYFSILRNFGYKVIIKPVKKFRAENGDEFLKANVDLEMAVDMMTQANTLDKVFLLTGDSDFKQVVRALQNKGVRVETIAFKNVGKELLRESDQYTSGYLVPNLLPIEEQEFDIWGQLGSRVRGLCYEIQPKHNFGFFRYLDIQNEYQSAFFHFSELPEGHYARHEGIYEFELDENEKGRLATNIKFIN